MPRGSDEPKKSSLLWLLPGVSQFGSSIGNMLIPFLGLRSLSIDDFGTLSLGYLTIHLASQIVRSTVGEAGLIYGRQNLEANSASRSISILGALASLALGLIVFALALVLSEATSSSYRLLDFGITLALCSLGVGIAETTKLSLLSDNRVIASALVDLAWLALQLIGLTVVFLVYDPTIVNLLLVWGVSGLLACIPYLAASIAKKSQQKVTLLPFKTHSPRLLVDCLVQYAGPFGLVALLGIFGGSAQVGFYQASIFLFRPIQLILSSASIAVLTAKSRSQHLRSDASMILVTVVVGVLTTVAVMNLLPINVGEWFLAENWSIAVSYWYVGAVNTGFWVGSQVLFLVLKAKGRTGDLIVSKLSAAICFLGLGLLIPVSTVETAAFIIAFGSLLSVVVGLGLMKRPMY